MSFIETFDNAVVALLEQGEKSMNPEEEEESGGCAYRDNHGRRCFVGHMLPDGMYDPCFEGSAVSLVWGSQCNGDDELRAAAKLREALVAAGVDVSDMGIRVLLLRGQTIHDVHPVPEWRDRYLDLRRIAWPDEPEPTWAAAD
jgi:hypothetical protein